MPLSIFSSERPIPQRHWRRILPCLLIVCILFLLAWELHWRDRGYSPTLNDTSDLWASARCRLIHSPQRTVIIGASRAHFDFDLDVFQEYFKIEKPVQLSLPGCNANILLEHIANDDSISGTVICGVVPGLFFAPEGFPVDRSKEAIKYFKQWSPSQKVGHYLGMWLERRLAFIQQEDLTLNALIGTINLSNRPKAKTHPQMPPYFYTLDEDRRARMWSKVESDSTLAQRIQQIWLPLFTPPPPPPQMTHDEVMKMVEGFAQTTLNRAKASVDKIQARGGNVVFIRFPSSGDLRERENKFTPRQGYWDRIIASTGAPGIHFEDYPEISSFNCPEWSHLSESDARLFTQALMPILERMLTDSESPQELTRRGVDGFRRDE